MEGLWEAMQAKHLLMTALKKHNERATVSPEWDGRKAKWVLLVRGVCSPVDEFMGYEVVNIKARGVSDQ